MAGSASAVDQGNGGSGVASKAEQPGNTQDIKSQFDAFNKAIDAEGGKRTSERASAASERIINAIKEKEGLRLNAYWDHGQWSIGYGSRSRPGERITVEEADRRLRGEVAKIENTINKNITIPLNQNQYDALVSFGYSLGPGGINALKDDINCGLFERAAGRMLSFNKAGGVVLPGLVQRRAEEAALFQSGALPQAKASPADMRLLEDLKYSHVNVRGFNPTFAAKLADMLRNLPPEYRGQVRIFSGYRSFGHQATLFRNAVAKYGSAWAARKHVAPPGRSNHNHGLAADLRYLSPGARQWVHAHAAGYGLHFRMAHEPWHIEMIGGRRAARTPLVADGRHAVPLAGTVRALRASASGAGTGPRPGGLVSHASYSPSGSLPFAASAEHAGDQLPSFLQLLGMVGGKGDPGASLRLLLLLLEALARQGHAFGDKGTGPSAAGPLFDV